MIVLLVHACPCCRSISNATGRNCLWNVFIGRCDPDRNENQQWLIFPTSSREFQCSESVDLIWWHCFLPFIQASVSLWGADTEPIIWVWECSDYLIKATAQLKTMAHSLKNAWMKILLCCISLISLGSHFLRFESSRSGSRFLCDPSQCHCLHGESLVNARVLIFSPVTAIGLKPLADKRLKRGDKHINLHRPSSQLLPLCLCTSQDVAFPGPSGRIMSPPYPGRM